jgi:hypothetical protein
MGGTTNHTQVIEQSPHLGGLMVIQTSEFHTYIAHVGDAAQSASEVLGGRLTY